MKTTLVSTLLGMVLVFAIACSSDASRAKTIANDASATPPAAADRQSKLDPQMKAVLDELASLGGKPIESLPPEEARKQPTPADSVKSLMKKKGMSTEPEPVGKTEDRKIGSNPARVYWPKEGKKPYPLVVYYHGGGWVIADINVYDATPRAIADQAGAIVISAEYRHAPEHKFPSAHDDAFAAYKWALANAKSLGGDPKKVAVMGESAGGNMAAAVSMMAREQKVQMPIYQALVYPVGQCGRYDSKSYNENAMAKPLNKAMMEYFCKNYVSKPEDQDNPHLSIVKAKDLKGLPAATVITDEIDPLMSEGKQYADMLKDAGVKVEYKNYDGVTHEFFGMGTVVDKAKDAEAKVASDLRSAFSK